MGKFSFTTITKNCINKKCIKPYNNNIKNLLEEAIKFENFIFQLQYFVNMKISML